MDNQNPPSDSAPIIDASSYIKKKFSRILLYGVVCIVLFELALIIILGPAALVLTFHIILFPVIGLSVVYYFIRIKAMDEFFSQFAARNNFLFFPMALPPNLVGSLFNIGHSGVGRDLVTGKYEGLPFNLFNYQYTVGSGKNSQTFNYTIFRLEILSPLTPIFLRYKDFTLSGSYSTDLSSQAKEKIQLEGDFDKYFDLWTENGFEIEALQIFTPDFMQKIQDNLKNFSLEFVSNQIYVYSHHLITTDKDLENMYQFIDYLAGKIPALAKELEGDVEALKKYY